MDTADISVPIAASARDGTMYRMCSEINCSTIANTEHYKLLFDFSECKIRNKVLLQP